MLFIKKSRSFTLSFILIFFCLKNFAQYIPVPPVPDGSISAGEYGNTTDGSNQITNRSTTTYITWDASNLYIAVSGASVSDATIIYIDKDNMIPVNGGGNVNGVLTGSPYDNTNFLNLPFRADLVLYARNGMYQYKVNNNGVWSSASTLNMAYGDNAVGGGNIKEFSIAWSVLGGPIPAAFNFFCYNTNSSGNVYNQLPANNSSGNIGVAALYERYYTVSSTADASATLPFTRECYVFNNFSNETNMGSVSVFDFTMNNNANIITRDNVIGGDWVINGTMVIASGTVDFGSVAGGVYGNTNITNISQKGGSFNADQNTNPLLVSGNISLSGGIFKLSSASGTGGDLLLGGDFTKTAGTFSCNGRKINFNGTIPQTWKSNSTENIDNFLVSNTSSGGVTAISSLTVGTNGVNSFSISAGSLYRQQGGSLTFNNSLSGTIAGTLENNSALIVVPVAPNAANVSVLNGGIYNHNANGGSIPLFTWNAGSTCEITGWTNSNSTPAGLAQNFCNFFWNSNAQTVNLNFGGNLKTISGDLNVAATGTGAISLTATTALTLNISGNFIQSGGNLFVSNGSSAPVINLTKDFIQSGGLFDFNPVAGSNAYLNIGGNFTRSGGVLKRGGSSANGTIIFNGSGTQNINSLNTTDHLDYQVAASATVILGNDFSFSNSYFLVLTFGTLNCVTYKLSGASTVFTMQGHSTLKTGSTDIGGALMVSAASGSIQTTTRNFDTNGHFEFTGSSAQYSGDFATSVTPINTIYSLLINNSGGVIGSGVSISSPLIISRTLNITTGKCTTTNVNTITLLSSASASGGSSTAFVDGPVTQILGSNLSGNGTYYFPLGSNTTFLPFSLINPSTGSTGPSITVKAFNTNCGGSADGIGTTSISNTEYWSAVVNSGSLTNTLVRPGRSIALGTFNGVGYCTTLNGSYKGQGGSIFNSTSITSTINQPAPAFFVLAVQVPAPVISSIVPVPIPGISTPNNSGYFSQVLTINGANFISSGLVVAIDNVNVPYTYINASKITATVPANIVNDFLVITNSETTFSGKVAFQFNGYLTNQSGDWNTPATWFGNALPISGATITIKNGVLISADVINPAGNVTIKSNGTLTIDPGTNPSANLKVNAQVINNNIISMTNNSSIIIADGGIFDNSIYTFNTSGNSNLHYLGSGQVLGILTLNNIFLDGSVYFSNTVNIKGALQINAGGGISTNAPNYQTAGRLIYNTGTTPFAPGLEWSSNIQNNDGCPNAIDIGQNVFTNIDLTLGNKPGLVNGILHIVTGNLTWNNSVQSLTVNGDLIIDATGQANLSTQPGGDLILKSNFINSGIFNSNAGSVIFTNKSADQNFYGEVPTTFNILTVDKGPFKLNFAKTVSGNRINYLTNSLNVVSGTLDLSSSNLVLRSSSSQTASITNITGSIVNANNLTAERYFPAHRCWRLVGSPLNSSQTINAAWQEGQVNTSTTSYNNNLGYGTLISGSQAGNLGFDYTARNSPSLKMYNLATDTWTGVPNTNVMNLSSQSAYMLFVRGSRASGYNPNGSSDATVLRCNGTLVQGDQNVVINTASNQFTAVGNPYPCAIDFQAVTKTGGLGDKFVVWDPKLTGNYGVGGFITFTWDVPSSSYKSSVAPVSAGLGQYIQSGQAFMIQGSGSSQNLTFHESSKYVGNSSATVFTKMGGDAGEELIVQLHIKNSDGTYSLEDGTSALYNDAYSNDHDPTDAGKISNLRENIYLCRNADTLAIEARKIITDSDTLFVGLSTYKTDYNLRMIAQNLDHPGLTGFLEDSYTNTQTALNLNDTTNYGFTVNTDVASQAADRFRIIFKKLETLPVTFTTVAAALSNEKVTVSWHVENQVNIKNYEVERSADGLHFEKIQSLDATKGSSRDYSIVDDHPGSGKILYRVKSIGLNGEIVYSEVVSVLISEVKQTVRVYPNPIVNGDIHIHFNKYEKGEYRIKILNSLGQVMVTRSEMKSEGQGGTISLHCNMPKGKYEVEIMNPDGSVINIPLIN